ncbi:MAG: DNA-3-methyladenine glycosylase I [Thaumarchaeota archaeon]|nr:DNA-3-methyladenine glycosylase I [Nitrososphaerota archaeon]
MPQAWKADPPKTDDGYFERMSRAIFQAGLNWRMIENKWPNFRKAFADFSVEKVSKFGDKEVRRLMKDTGIVRNEKKIKSSITNAQEYEKIKKEFGTFSKYVDGFRGDEEKLIADLRSRFRFLGESSARTFLYMVGFDLRPTKEEMAWHSANKRKAPKRSKS